MCCSTDNVCVSFEGQLLEDSDKLRACGANRELRGGGAHKNKKLSAEQEPPERK